MKDLTQKFITLEGCEGVGKTTQVQLLKDYCAANKIDAVFTREPGGTPIAERIRSVILEPDCTDMDALTELFLYAASRRQHTKEVIIPALQAGKIVFCDRYSDSTIAYQAYGRGLDVSTVEKICSFAGGNVIIDYTVFLDLDPSEGFRRIKSRNYADRLEQAGIEFHQKVYAGFKALAQKHPRRFVSVDAGQDAQTVHKDVIKQLKERGVLL